jgi:hypothetical protein
LHEKHSGPIFRILKSTPNAVKSPPRFHPFPLWQKNRDKEELTARLTSFDEKKYKKITQQFIHKSD